jgi:hypothetical protein
MPYPNLFPILAAPLYLLAGYHGLLLLNALAFVAVVWLTVVLARRLFGDPDLALDAAFVLVLGTYAWDYAQAAWPHMTSALFVMVALVLCAMAMTDTEARRGLGLAFAAGLVASIGVGVRFDTAFVLPALVLPFLFMTPPRPGAALAVALGCLPGLAGVAAMNAAKFGMFSPFTYGLEDAGPAEGIAPYLPLAAVGAGALAVLWLVTRPRARAALGARKAPALACALLVLGAALLIPESRALFERLADGFAQLVVDLRLRPLGIEEGGLSRGPGGGMVYLGALKKSLLQSLPYLVLLAVPLAELARGRNARALGMLFLAPAAFVGAYSYFAWHGGLALNLRYFVPVLPALAILAAYAWRAVVVPGGRVPAWAWALAAAAALAVRFIAAPPGAAAPETLEAVFLSLPLALAGALLALVLAWLLTGRGAALRAGVLAAGLAAFAWAGTVAFTHDVPRGYFMRQLRGDFAATLGPLVASDSLLFTGDDERFFGLIDKGRVRFAVPMADDFQTFRPLAEHHLDAGRPIYAWLTPEIAATLEARGLLRGLREQTLFEGARGRLVTLSRAP